MTAPNTAVPAEPEFVEDVFDEDEQEGTPEAPPASPAQPDSEAAPAQADPAHPADGSQPRDEQGRFKTQAEQDAASAGQPAPAVPAPAVAPEAPAPAPYAFRADGKDWSIDGATVSPDGSLVVPKARLADLQGLLAEGIAHRGSWRQREKDFQQQVADAKAQNAFEVDRGTRLWNLVVEQLQKSPDQVAEWLDGLQAELPRILNEVQQQALETEKEALRASHGDIEVERQAQQLLPQLTGTLQHYTEQIAQRYPGVDPRKVYEKFYGRLDSVFAEATEDMPDIGVKQGAYYIRLDQLEQEFQWAKNLLDAAKAASDTAAKNTAAVTPAPVPPTVVGKGTPPGGEAKKIPSFKTKEEADQWIASGAWRKL